jgi:NAD(P)H-nitrite reductase large subunit
MYDIVVLGGGAAGHAAATAARKQNSGSTILLLSEEPHPPIDRTKLSKDFSRRVDPDAILLAEADWYARQGIDLRTATRADALDAEDHTITTADGEEIQYGSLVYAAGAEPHFPKVVRPHEAGSFYVLRTVDDAIRLGKKQNSSKNVLIAGMGVLAVEVASRLRQQGKKVTMAGATPQIMPRHLDPRAGEIIEGVLLDNKIKLLFQEEILSFEQSNKGTMHVQMIKHSGQYDMVVFCIGVTPRTALAEGAGLEVNKGVVVDDHMRTSVADVYAAGEAAEHNGGLMTDVWKAAEYQGTVAGTNAAGGNTALERRAFSLETEVFGTHFLSINKPANDLDYHVEETEEDDTYICFFYNGTSLEGVVAVNDRENVEKYEQAVAEQWKRRSVEETFLPVS